LFSAFVAVSLVEWHVSLSAWMVDEGGAVAKTYTTTPTHVINQDELNAFECVLLCKFACA
jgi:hypothetical protein